MAIANTTIQLKKSSVSGNVPAALANGELALNYADGRLYYKNASGVITYISSGGGSSNSFATINANSSLILASSPTDILSVVPGNNITIIPNTTSKTFTVGLANNISLYYNPSAQQQAAVISVNGANTKGGITYIDFLNANNQSVGATNTNKWFRLDSSGTFQIINSAYTQNIFNLTDAGDLTVPGNFAAGISGANYIQFGDGTKQYTANAGGGSTDTTARNMANAAYNQANNVNTYAISAYAQANATAGGLTTANTNITVIQGVDTTQNTNITTANNAAWAAYAQANDVNTYAISAYTKANNALANTGVTVSANGLTSYVFSNNVTIGGATGANGALTYGGVTLAKAVTGTGNMVLSVSPSVTGTLTASGINASGAINFNTTGSAIQIGSGGSAACTTVTIGSTTGTAQITVGQSTGTQTVSIANGATTNVSTKTVNIGTAGIGGSYTNITLGSSVAGSLGTTTLYGPNVTFTAANTAQSVVRFSGTTASVSNTTGTVLISGGLGITGNIYADAVYDGGVEILTVAQNAFNAANVVAGGLTTANASITVMQGVNDTQNTNITTANNAAWAGFAQANAVNTYAVSAYAQANNVNTYAISAYAQANATAGGLTTANSAITAIQGVNDTQNTQITVIQGVDAGQNAFMQAAFNKANTSIQTSGDQTITGNLTVSKDLTVTGNLTILGNTATINTSSFAVTDSLITLSIGNYTSDALDIGFAGHYNAGTNAHAGLIRDPNRKEWILFQGYTPEIQANNLINIADPSFAYANLYTNYIKSNLIATNASVNGWDVSSVWSTQNTNITAVNTYASSGYSLANTHTGQITVIQGVDTTQNAAITVIQGVDVTQNTNITAINTYAGSAYAKANSALANTTGTFAGDLNITGNILPTIANTTTLGSPTLPFKSVYVGPGSLYVANISLSNTNSVLTISNVSDLQMQGMPALSTISSVANTASANTIYTQGVDNTQNTNITAVNTYAASAYAQANTDYTNVSLTAGTYGNTTYVPVVTVAANGRVTAVSTSAINAGGSSFGYISVQGSSSANIVAATSNTKINFKAESGVSITPYAANNTVSIGILGGIQGVTMDWGLITDTISAVTFDFGPTLT